MFFEKIGYNAASYLEIDDEIKTHITISFD